MPTPFTPYSLNIKKDDMAKNLLNTTKKRRK